MIAADGEVSVADHFVADDVGIARRSGRRPGVQRLAALVRNGGPWGREREEVADFLPLLARLAERLFAVHDVLAAD